MGVLKRHNCKFTAQERRRISEMLNKMYPMHTRFSNLRRKFRTFTLISEENSRKCFTPMGSTEYIFQKEQHLSRHPYMIHPYSKFCLYWQFLALTEFTLSFTVRLFLNSQLQKCLFKPEYQIYAFTCDLFETSDVLLKLVIGYVDPNTQRVVLEFRKIILHNVFSFWFYMNLFISLPIEFFAYLYYLIIGSSSEVISVFVYFKVFKIFSLSRYVSHIGKIYNWKELTFRGTMCFFIMFFLCHWLTCLMCLGNYYFRFSDLREEKDSQMILDTRLVFYRHLESFYLVCTVFFGQGRFLMLRFFDIAVPTNIMYFMINNIIIFSRIFFMSVFIQLIGLSKTSWYLYRELKQEIQKLLAQENLPKQMHEKVLRYMKFYFCQRYFDEDAILETLSPPLKREVKHFLCYDLVKNPESIFNCLPEDKMSELCMQLKLRVYLAGDTVFRAGQRSRYVYFLYSGSVVVYSSRGKELMHWYKGQQFGVAAFLERHMYLVTALALETSEIYVLRYSDFLKIMEETPELLEMVIKAANSKIENLLREFSIEPW